MRHPGAISGSRGGVGLRPDSASPRWKHVAPVAAKTMAGGLLSAALSTIVASVVGTGHGRSAPHVAFLAAAGGIAVILELSGYSIGHIDPGFLFAFFLFEPVGPIVMRQQTVPAGLAATVILGLSVAGVFAFRSSHRAVARGLDAEPPGTQEAAVGDAGTGHERREGEEAGN